MNHGHCIPEKTRMIVFRFVAVLLLAWPSSQALSGDGEIMFVNSFEGTGSVPQFIGVDNQAVAAETLLEIDVDTFVPASQSGLTWSLDQRPAGMTINAITGLLNWTPARAQVGAHPVTVRVEDLAGLSNTLDFDVEVIETSAVPLIEPIADRALEVGSLFQVQVIAVDSDPGDDVEFSLDAAPPDMFIDPGTGLIDWLPDSGDIGSVPVVVRATDTSGQFDTEPFTLIVVTLNTAPALDPIADRGAAPEVEFQIQLSAEDPDPGDTLFWSLLERPAGMSIEPDTGLLRWAPTSLQLGPHEVTVVVTDALGAADQGGFAVFVDLNRAPVAVDDDGGRVELGDTLQVAAPGVLANDSDPNSDVLSALLVTPPQRGSLTLSAGGGFEYTPDVPVGTIGLVEKYSFDRSGGGETWVPLIGNLDDDVQAELIVYDTSSGNHDNVTAIDGSSGQLEWITTFQGRQLDGASKPALADIDLDGQAEILVIGGDADVVPPSRLRLYAFEHDGQIKWISEDLPHMFYLDGVRSSNRQLNSAAITVADLDQDGTPEILAAPDFGPSGYHVWDHEGRTLQSVHEPGTSIGDGSPTRVTVADLDLDGDPEIVVGNVAWSHDGALLWKRVDNFTQGIASSFPIVANLDDDPYPELVRTRGGTSFPDNRGNVVAWNHDGTDLWEVPRDSGFNEAPITIADVDADGFADVLLPNANAVNVFEVLDGRDGSVKWSKSVTTRSVGATVFDLDRDGFVEVVFVDESARVYVWDGRDGTEKLAFDSDKPRPASFSIPVFADVDADGAAELVIPGGGSFSTAAVVSVWESPADDWAPMRPIWNEQRYHVTNVNDDLTIPAVERPHWLLAGLNQAMINQRLPEARVETTDSFSYRASDGQLQSNTAEVTIEVLPPNAPPRILSAPPVLASPGFEYVYNVLAVDADAGELLDYAIAEGPAGMDVDGNGRLTWIPGGGDLGLHAIVVSVTDTLNVTAYQNFTVEVRPAVVVPALGGLTETAAIDALEAASLRADPLRDVFSDTVAIGEVAAQNPAPGTPIAAGSGVAVEISRGPVPVGVPRLVGLDEDDALTTLVAAGLFAGPIERVNNPGVPRGMIASQDPPPNALVPPGSDVAFVVSGGPRAVITVDPPLIPAGASATVSVEVRDSNGMLLDPQPDVALALDFDIAQMFGTPPSLDGSIIDTGPDTQGEFTVEATFDTGVVETVAAGAAVLPAISDGAGGTIYSEFTTQLEAFTILIEALAEAVDAGDGPAIEALDASLGELAASIDVRRLRTMTVIAPEGGVPPTPSQAIAGGLSPSAGDNAYSAVGLDLLVLLEEIDALVRTGTVSDVIMNTLNQDLAAAATAKAALDPSAVGVLRAAPIITAVLGTYAPRVLVADIRALRQALRDAGVIAEDGTARPGRFTLPGMLSAVRIRNDIVKDFYVPYLGEVARAMGAVIAADLLQDYFNAGAIVGIVTGASQSIHVFEIQPSVIEGFGFDPTLSPNNSVTMVGPSLFDAVGDAASGLPSASDFKEVNTAFDAIQTQIDNANAIDQAWDDANSKPNGVTRGCILDGTPGCRQLIYPNGFASVYEVDGGLSLPAPVLIITRNLESGGTAVFIANFVPTNAEE